MIDTHCHLLAGVDDGPATIDDSVELALALVAQGVESVVCTPHLSRAFPVTQARALEALAALELELGRRRIDLELTLAAEVSDVNAVTLGGAELRERSIAGRYLVVELSRTVTAAAAELLTRRLGAAGLLPVVSHPERLQIVRRDPGSLDGVRALGGLVQVMASSLTGRWGEAVGQTAWELLDTGRADLVASDAHGTLRRRCHLDEARELVCRRAGQACWDELTIAAPARVLGGAR